jgi:hypothetical protein
MHDTHNTRVTVILSMGSYLWITRLQIELCKNVYLVRVHAQIDRPSKCLARTRGGYGRFIKLEILVHVRDLAGWLPRKQPPALHGGLKPPA